MIDDARNHEREDSSMHLFLSRVTKITHLTLGGHPADRHDL
jgi:hypothetical protein